MIRDMQAQEKYSIQNTLIASLLTPDDLLTADPSQIWQPVFDQLHFWARVSRYETSASHRICSDLWLSRIRAFCEFECEEVDVDRRRCIVLDTRKCV